MLLGVGKLQTDISKKGEEALKAQHDLEVEDMLEDDGKLRRTATQKIRRQEQVDLMVQKGKLLKQVSTAARG